MTTGEEERAEEERRRNQAPTFAADAKSGDVRNGQADETDRPAKRDDDGDERARQKEKRGAESGDVDAEGKGAFVAER